MPVFRKATITFNNSTDSDPVTVGAPKAACVYVPAALATLTSLKYERLAEDGVSATCSDNAGADYSDTIVPGNFNKLDIDLYGILGGEIRFVAPATITGTCELQLLEEE